MLCLLLANRSVGGRNGLGVELAGLPDEVLQQIAIVLGQEQILGLFYDVIDVGNKAAALGRELLRRIGESLGFEEAVQGDIDLVVLQGGLALDTDMLLSESKRVRTEGTLPVLKALMIP